MMLVYVLLIMLLIEINCVLIFLLLDINDMCQKRLDMYNYVIDYAKQNNVDYVSMFNNENDNYNSFADPLIKINTKQT